MTSATANIPTHLLPQPHGTRYFRDTLGAFESSITPVAPAELVESTPRRRLNGAQREAVLDGLDEIAAAGLGRRPPTTSLAPTGKALARARTGNDRLGRTLLRTPFAGSLTLVWREVCSYQPSQQTRAKWGLGLGGESEYLGRFELDGRPLLVLGECFREGRKDIRDVVDWGAERTSAKGVNASLILRAANEAPQVTVVCERRVGRAGLITLSWRQAGPDVWELVAKVLVERPGLRREVEQLFRFDLANDTVQTIHNFVATRSISRAR